MPRTILLPCPLQPDEVRDRGASLAQTIKRLDRLDERRKRVSTAIRERKKVLDDAKDRLARAISSGSEDREVPVEDRLDDTREPKRVITIRLDTGAAVDTRAAHTGDLQLPMFRGDGSAADAAEAATEEREAAEISGAAPTPAPSPKRRRKPRKAGDPDIVQAGSELS